MEDSNRDAAKLERVCFASIWTQLDLMIMPANSSRLSVGEEFRIPVPLHPWVFRSRRVLKLVTGLSRVGYQFAARGQGRGIRKLPGEDARLSISKS
jgi:hypothetical protein